MGSFEFGQHQCTGWPAGQVGAVTQAVNASRACIGQQLYLKLVDRATGALGHIYLDYVRVPIQQAAAMEWWDSRKLAR
jgi:hypothetical protein